MGPFAGSDVNVPVTIRWLVVGLIRGYQISVSPWLPPACRFVPTCSEYAAEAVGRHGVIAGLRRALQRLLRCHPFHAGGVDPVD